MTVLITLTTAGTDAGPFDIYPDVGGYLTSVATNVTRLQLLAGYPATVPDGTTSVILRPSIGATCTNSITLATGVPVTCTIYQYVYELHRCDCTLVAASGSFNNTNALTVGKYYAYPPDKIIKIRYLNACLSTGGGQSLIDADGKVNCADVVCPTTTTTSTTPDPGGFLFTTGAATSAAACILNYSTIMYPTSGVVTLGNTVYTDAAKTIPLPGAMLWYKSQGYAWLIDNNGKIVDGTFCVV